MNPIDTTSDPSMPDIEGDPAARPLRFYDGHAPAARAAKQLRDFTLLQGLEEVLTDYLTGTFEESFRTAELHIDQPGDDAEEWHIGVSILGGAPSAEWSLEGALTRTIAEIADPNVYEPAQMNAVFALADMLERKAAAMRAAARLRNPDLHAS